MIFMQNLAKYLTPKMSSNEQASDKNIQEKCY